MGSIVIERDARHFLSAKWLDLVKRGITTAKKFSSFTRRWNEKANERERSFRRYYFSCLCYATGASQIVVYPDL